MKGLAQAIILSAEAVYRGATPGKKITPYGYLQYLLGNNIPNVISSTIDDGSGYIRDVIIRMMQRSGPGESVTVDDCSIQTTGAYLDVPVGTTLFRALGVTFQDDMIAKFMEDALAPKQVGKPATTIMQEVWDVILSKVNGLMADIDTDLTTIQSVNFGKNIVTGLNTAKNVNFTLDGTMNDLTTGMTGIMADAMNNEMMMNGASIVGNGIIINYALQQATKGFDQSGVNTKLMAIPDIKFDPVTSPVWGVNDFGLFEKDAVSFINICRFRGMKGGTKGNSYYFTLKLPVRDSVGQGGYENLEFDVQLTYRECPGEMQIGPASDLNPPVLVGRGWNIILMSSYQQVNIPINAYKANDRLFGNNGTYLFHATNT